MKKYKSFLFNEADWQKVFNKTSEVVLDSVKKEEEPSLNDVSSVNLNSSVESVVSPVSEKPFNSIENNRDTLNNVETLNESQVEVDDSFAKIRKELEGLQGQLQELDALKDNNFLEEISFADIEPEVYNDTDSNRYRRAA